MVTLFAKDDLKIIQNHTHINYQDAQETNEFFNDMMCRILSEAEVGTNKHTHRFSFFAFSHLVYTCMK